MCCGNGKISVKFVRYENRQGKLSNGNCCDGRAKFCMSDCDHLFKICIDGFSGYVNQSDYDGHDNQTGYS